MAVDVKVVKNVNIPTDFTLGKQFYEKAALHLWQDQSNAVNGKNERVDGGKIKRNSKGTLERKRMRGQPQISLVDGWRGGGPVKSAPKGDKMTLNEIRGMGGAKGHMTNQHHFVGKAAFSIRISKLSASVQLKPDAIEIAKRLDEAGYVQWFGIREKTQTRILNEAKVALRYMGIGAVKRAKR